MVFKGSPLFKPIFNYYKLNRLISFKSSTLASSSFLLHCVPSLRPFLTGKHLQLSDNYQIIPFSGLLLVHCCAANFVGKTFAISPFHVILSFVDQYFCIVEYGVLAFSSDNFTLNSSVVRLTCNQGISVINEPI